MRLPNTSTLWVTSSSDMSQLILRWGRGGAVLADSAPPTCTAAAREQCQLCATRGWQV
jgi:hypothetical protein